MIIFCLCAPLTWIKHFDRDKPPAGRDRRGGRSPSPAKERTSSNWRPRKKSSNFDVRPPDGLELPPIGVMTPVNGVPNSYFSFTNNPLGILKDVPDAPTQQVIHYLILYFFSL